MQAREVVEVTGGEPPFEGGRGSVVGPHRQPGRGGDSTDRLDDHLVGGQGRPRQFSEIWLNKRCSIRFHFDVAGGRWVTVISSPVSAASPCAPRDTVSALAFAAAATTFIPPYPIARASAPSSSRHARSSRKRPDLREPGRHPVPLQHRDRHTTTLPTYLG
jgi:hypothetical protein